MKKGTAVAPSNIAFVKYWGKRNNTLTLPNNGSISMSLDSLWTKTTVAHAPEYKEDEVWIKSFRGKFEKVDGSKKDRVINQIVRLKKMAGIKNHVKVMSENNFPSDVGIASSASGFCALTAAATQAFGMKISEKKLSILTRLGGSGSAVRSVFGGFVEWKKGSSAGNSYAVQLAPETHWDLADVVAIVSTKEKKVSSLEGHDLVKTSPYYQARLKTLPHRLAVIRKAIQKKDFSSLGKEIEKDAISLHVVAMTCDPAVFYLNGRTLDVIEEVLDMRKEGIPAFYTMDAGPNVHIICEKKNMERIAKRMKKLPYVSLVLASSIGRGVRYSDQHLF